MFNDALIEKGINAKLYMQATNSPVINLLDMGFFRAIQSFNDAAPKNEEELIQLVSTAYNNHAWNKINQTWLTLQCCFNQIIMHNRDNDYNIDHITKEKLECIGKLQDVIEVVEDTAQLDRILTYGTLLDVLWQMYHAWITYGMFRRIA